MSHLDKDRFTMLTIPPSSETALGVLSAPVRGWFQGRLGEPTLAQRSAWPVIGRGENLLLSAPTGTGKTLAAFLPILDHLFSRHTPCPLLCLYVSPLKALCNDVRRNLQAAIREAGEGFDHSWLPTVGLRTGDVSAQVRKALWTAPPTILVTTPESLAVLLTQKQITSLFSEIRWLIVDEIHDLLATKRGADLAASLERVEAIAGRPVQRIGLSATCRPLNEAASFLVGGERACTLAAIRDQADLDVKVEALGVAVEAGGGNPSRFFSRVVDRLERELEGNRTVLVFTNSRGLAERLAYTLRGREVVPAEQVGVHHSALSAGRRKRLERELKAGRVRVVVCTSSLELGLDIGSVDLVILLHPPGAVVRMLQRVGRSGHGPGRIRRGLVLVSSPAELMEAAATCASGGFGQTELLAVAEKPLDVLCQQMLGMAAEERYSVEEAFVLMRRAYPFRDLSREEFDDCLRYLSGKDRQGRDWLPARMRAGDSWLSLVDALTLRILRRNLGTILGERQTEVKNETERLIGEVDEAFAERLQPGDRFLLDGRCLEYRTASRNAISVTEVVGRPVVPRWLSDGWPVSRELAGRIYLLRCQALQALRQDGGVIRFLEQEYGLERETAGLLGQWFEVQDALSEIPDADECLIEAIASDMGVEYYFHTPLNRLGNEALARVAVSRLHRLGIRCMSPVAADLGFLLFVESCNDLSPGQWRVIFAAEGFAGDLELSIRDSAIVRERFRRVALTALMLLKNPLGDATKVGGRDWAERRLYQKIQASDGEFVLLRQALREVKQSFLDEEAAVRYVGELPGRVVKIRWLSAVSPFAASWTQSAQEPDEHWDAAEALEKLHATLMGSEAAKPQAVV
jgi:ATP-dependent Lhr-like helicase